MLAHIPNNNLCFPIHTAALSGTDEWLPLSVFKLLLKKFPYALQLPNKHGFLPVHCALQINEHLQVSKELIQFLLDAYPEAAMHKSCSGQLPLHLACARKMDTTEIIEILMEKNPHGQYEYDDQGHLPFHISCVVGNIQAIEYWIKRMDKRSKLPLTNNGTHPLFLACERNQAPDVIYILLLHSLELFSGGCWRNHE